MKQINFEQIVDNIQMFKKEHRNLRNKTFELKNKLESMGFDVVDVIFRKESVEIVCDSRSIKYMSISYNHGIFTFSISHSIDKEFKLSNEEFIKLLKDYSILTIFDNIQNIYNFLDNMADRICYFLNEFEVYVDFNFYFNNNFYDFHIYDDGSGLKSEYITYIKGVDFVISVKDGEREIESYLNTL